MTVGFESFVFATTPLGLGVPAFRWTPSRASQSSTPKILVLGGVHGNEVEGTTAAFGCFSRWKAHYPFSFSVTLVPAFNLEGVIARERLNSRGVDLNRNVPTSDWNPKAFDAKYPPGPSANSEPENQALVQWIEENKPDFILSLHSWHPLLNVNGNCTGVAQVISALTGYEIKEEMGYPAPGCLGTYGAVDKKIPVLTYEIERGLPLDQVMGVHVPAIEAGLKALAFTN